MEKIRNLSLRKSIIVYMLTGIVIGFILGAVIALEAERAQEQIWWKYVDQDRFIEEMQNRNPDAFDVTIPRVSNEDMSRTDASLSELCDFLTTYGILVLCAAGIVVSTFLFYRNKIRRPLLELNLAAKKIADNDLDFEIGYQSKDELGVLCREFDHMKEELAQNNQKMWRMVEDEPGTAICHCTRSADASDCAQRVSGNDDGVYPGRKAGPGSASGYAERKHGTGGTAGAVSGPDAGFLRIGTGADFLHGHDGC